MSATYYNLNLKLCLSPYVQLGITQIFWDCRKDYFSMQGKIWVNIFFNRDINNRKSLGDLGDNGFS